MIEMFDVPIARSFLTDGENENEDEGEIRPLPLILPLYFNPLAPGQEQIRILLISSPTWVRETIHDLHSRGFCQCQRLEQFAARCQFH